MAVALFVDGQMGWDEMTRLRKYRENRKVKERRQVVH